MDKEKNENLKMEEKKVGRYLLKLRRPELQPNLLTIPCHMFFHFFNLFAFESTSLFNLLSKKSSLHWPIFQGKELLSNAL